MLKSESNNSGNRWYPQSVEELRNSINLDDWKEKSNFSYSMQYIEFLELQIDELNISSALIAMIYKSYIITGMSIIEMLFQNLLKKSKNWNMTSWEEKSNFESNKKKYGNVYSKVKTIILEEVDSYEMRMDLDSMIKKIDSKKLISIESNNFPALKKLRELRNKVHLQREDFEDHDYNSFGFEDIQMMRRILHLVLTSKEIIKEGHESKFEFLENSYQKYKSIEANSRY